MPKNDDLPHVARAKRVARELRRTLTDELALEATLSECQEAAARLLGFSGWHHLTRAKAPAIYPLDEGVPPQVAAERLARQATVLQTLMPRLSYYGDGVAEAVAKGLRPTGAMTPQSLRQAGRSGVYERDTLAYGMIEAYPTGLAFGIADHAGELLENDPHAAAVIALTAVTIDDACINGWDTLGIALAAHEGHDVEEIVGCHLKAAEAARAMMDKVREAWKRQYPDKDFSTYIATSGARDLIRPRLNFGIALMSAAQAGAIPMQKALREAQAEFSYVAGLKCLKFTYSAIDRSLMAYMLAGDTKGARRAAAAMDKYLKTPSCPSLWALAWADAMEGNPNGYAMAAAIASHGLVASLVLDGRDVEVGPYRDDGFLGDVNFAKEVAPWWSEQPRVMAALSTAHRDYRAHLAETAQQFDAFMAARSRRDRDMARMGR